MKKSVAIVSATLISFGVYVATLTITRREYAEHLLENVQATVLWKEGDSITGTMLHTHIIEKLKEGDEASALRSLCHLLKQDLKSLEDLAELSQDKARRRTTLSNGRRIYDATCAGHMPN